MSLAAAARITRRTCGELIAHDALQMLLEFREHAQLIVGIAECGSTPGRQHRGGDNQAGLCAFFAHSVSLTVMRSSLLRSLG